MKGRLSAQWVQQTVYIGPALLVFSIIVLLPFALGLYYSFTDWDGISGQAKWVGVENFATMFTEDKRYVNAFWFTIRYSAVVLVLTNVLAFVIALALSMRLKSRNLLRTIFFVPNVLGGILLGFIWQFVFTKGFPSIGEMTGLGFFKQSWLGTEQTAFWALVIVFVWHQAGYLMVIYIAGLANVPGEMLEAATIDGAGSWRKLFTITIPLIMPVVTVCLFLTLAWAFKMFDLNFSLTRGGPFNTSESVALNIYTEAFVNNRYGLGTAKAVVFFVVVSIITGMQVWLTRRKEVDM